jgi:hypothetical protein
MWDGMPFDATKKNPFADFPKSVRGSRVETFDQAFALPEIQSSATTTVELMVWVVVRVTYHPY